MKANLDRNKKKLVNKQSNKQGLPEAIKVNKTLTNNTYFVNVGKKINESIKTNNNYTDYLHHTTITSIYINPIDPNILINTEKTN
jgi:hypothetical protein